jgi:chemotaxis protein MotB
MRPGAIGAASKFREKQKMIRRFPIAAATLALSLTASASMAAEGNQLSQDDEQLKSALAGAPVIVKLEVASVTLSSSADAMFTSGGWQISSDSPLLNKMLPTFSKLRNTWIVVEGYTDNVQVGPELQAAGISNNLDLSAKRAVSVANYLTSHGVKPDLVSVQAFGESHPAASTEGRTRVRSGQCPRGSPIVGICGPGAERLHMPFLHETLRSGQPNCYMDDLALAPRAQLETTSLEQL